MYAVIFHCIAALGSLLARLARARLMLRLQPPLAAE